MCGHAVSTENQLVSLDLFGPLSGRFSRGHFSGPLEGNQCYFFGAII